MDDGKQLFTIWQRNLDGFRGVFTEPGFRLFSQWITATVLCDEQHTITQELIASGRSDDWRNFERFAEYGAFDLRAAELAGMQLIERRHACRFGRYHPAAIDDTKELRCSPHVWGVCTFKHVCSRNPKHPKLAMAHNWVVMGDLTPPDRPGAWTYLPTAARLYMRRGQLPRGERFATKLEQAAEMLKQLDGISAAPVLGIFDGGYARAKVIEPCLASGRRIEILTAPTLRCAAVRVVTDGQGPIAWRSPAQVGQTSAGSPGSSAVDGPMEVGERMGLRKATAVPLQVDDLPLGGQRGGTTGARVRL